MPDTIIGSYNSPSISLGKESAEYKKVVVINSEGEEFSAGTDDGLTLTVECPWASQSMADRLHAKFHGRKYQSFTASDAYVTPDVELGGKVNVAGVTSGIFQQRTEFDALMTSTISAPGEEELEHEFEYVSRVEREIMRQSRAFSRALGTVSQNAQNGILEARKELIAALTGADGAPTDLAAGLSAYVRYDLDNNTGYAETSLFAKIGEEAVAKIDQYVVTVDGADKTLKEAVTTITTRVGDAESALTQKASSQSVTDLSGRVTTVEEATTSLTSRVGDAEASLTLKASQDAVDGISQSVATLRADVVQLQGLTEVGGSLNVYGGNIYAKYDIEALTGTVVANTIGASEHFLIGGTEYTPQSITSTSGAVLYALGCA